MANFDGIGVGTSTVLKLCTCIDVGTGTVSAKIWYHPMPTKNEKKNCNKFKHSKNYNVFIKRVCQTLQVKDFFLSCNCSTLYIMQPY